MTVQDGDFIRLLMNWTLDDGTLCQNKFDFVAQFVSPEADSIVVDDIETWVEGAYGNLSSYLLNSMTQDLCLVEELEWSEVEGEWVKVRDVGSFTPTIAFNDANEGLPNQSSAFVTYNTARPRTRGRTFLPPFGEDAQDSSFLTGAVVSALVLFAADAIDTIDIDLLEKLVRVVLRTAVHDYRGLTAAVVTNVLGSQRRRRPGVGV